MSDKKTISVMEGDRFEYESHRSHAKIYQYRDGLCRLIGANEIGEWFDDDDTDDKYKMNTPLALAYLADWGYTLTPAKPEQPDHFGDSNEMVAATVKRLEERVAKLEAATTPAKVRVAAPGAPVYGDDDWKAGVKWEAGRWRAALAAAGVEVKEASNGKA
jgi:hypothetical protein